MHLADHFRVKSDFSFDRYLKFCDSKWKNAEVARPDQAGHNQSLEITSKEITSKEILRIIEEQLNWIPNPATLYFMITSLKGNFKLLKPLRNLSNNKLKIFANLTIWLLATILSSPVLFYQQLVTVGIRGVYVKKVCAEQYPDDRFRIIYAVLTFFIAFVIPLATLSYFHYKIKCFLNDHLLRFDLSREKLLNGNGSTTIKTISSKSPQLFMNAKRKRRGKLLLADRSEPVQFERPALEQSNPDSRLFAVQQRPGEKPTIGQIEESKKKTGQNFLTSESITINKISPIKALSAETILSTKKNCSSSSLSLSQLNHASLNQLKLNCSELDSSVNNSSPTNNSTPKSSSQPKPSRPFPLSSPKEKEAREGLSDGGQKRRPFNKRSPKRLDSLGYALIYRSLSDSNLLDLTQPSHNSFLHELNPAPPSSGPLTNLSRQVPADYNTMITSPSFSSQAFNLDYLRLINFDFNQKPNVILRHPEVTDRPEQATKKRTIKNRIAHPATRASLAS
ncbi:hypothetical protein L1887_55131 [Cichorium endivia]|nr:hypothetical protein L1887_55131 [Cichorium endivia]